jgi:transposase
MAGRTRREWPDEVKRQIVAETYADGASVAEVALRHAVNANLVFIWRKDPRFNPRLAGAGLLPVEITRSDSAPDTQPALNALPDVSSYDTYTEPPSIEIALPSGIRLTCRGGIDAAALADVLRALKTA